MSSFAFISSLLLVLVFVFVAYSAELDASSKFIEDKALYALKELIKLSDSKIYDTLKLWKVLSASSEEGVYHDNIIIQVELESPYFKSDKVVESFEFIVMTHKVDQIITIAVDEFPVMKDDAIESYIIKKIEDKRKKRESIIRDMELESILSESSTRAYGHDMLHIGDNTTVDDIRAIFEKVESADISSYRLKLSESLLPMLPLSSLADELALMNSTLFDLYHVSRSAVEDNNYRQFRAKQILNAVLYQLKKLNRAKHFADQTSSISRASAAHNEL